MASQNHCLNQYYRSPRWHSFLNQTPAKFLYMCDAVTAHKSVDDKDEDLYDKYIIIDTEEKAVDNDMIPESELLAFSSPP